MGLFNKKSGKENQPPYTDFEPGDVFYSDTDEHYHLSKVLAVDKKVGTLHVMMYQPMDQLPDSDSISSLQPFVSHAPIDINGFKNPQLLAKTSVEYQDLEGYFEYIKQTQNFDEVVKYAGQYYKEAYRLTDEKLFEAAIEQYSRAIDLLPTFYEALDNRAFVKMDLGRWEEAIADFELSLKIEPDTVLALFSIGECYFRLQNFPQAKVFFEQALEINPEDVHSRAFLIKTLQRIEE